MIDGENEKIDDITNAFPYWTTSKLRQFVNDARRLPFDAHLNVALIAPVRTKPSRIMKQLPRGLHGVLSSAQSFGI